MSMAAPSTSEPISAGNAPLPTLEQLPNDVDTLKQMVIELATTLRQARHNEDALQHRLHLLLQRIYGPRTERIHPDQGWLFPEQTLAPPDDVGAAPPATPQAAAPPTQRRRAKPHGRNR